MSLDVYLTGPTQTRTCVCEECGNEHEREYAEQLYWANITHNLNSMAGVAGIYEYVWRPKEIGVTKAAQLVMPLTLGIATMRGNPELFRKYDAANGWGTYDQFVPWLEAYLAACEANPDANVSVSR